jgi:signal transduction histidine kinase
MPSYPDQPSDKNAAARAERAVAAAGERLGELASAAGESSRSEFSTVAAAAVAHEIRNILTPCRARLELALMDLGDPRLVERSIQEALRGIERAGRAADAILAVVTGRIDVGQGADVAEAARLAADAIGPDASLVRIEGKRGTRVAMACIALEQVLMNLILNARSAGRSAPIFVRILTGSRDRVMIEVEDRGSGAPGGPFSGEGGRAAKRGGVGLIVCRHLVEAVGGTMTARSEAGMGTTVRVELPAAGSDRAGVSGGMAA